MTLITLRSWISLFALISPQPQEDVTYASIDHGNTKGPSRARTSADDDCDYATVYVPAALAAADVSECSSKDEGAEDYVLMG